ncbi:putative transcription factor C2C2-CO-like family [Helianthus annuus]|nr:putative transcription factor C2C2-CO-like family [Helianthus annuus]
MSYDMCEFEECFLTHPFSPLSDCSSIDILKTFQENNHNLNPLTHDILDTPLDEIDQITPTTTTTLSSSPPCHQLQNLSFYQMGNSVNSPYLSPLEIKNEESQLPLYDYYININSFLPHSYDGCDNLMKMMQRSLIESSNLQSMTLTSPDHSHMRRVSSTGDLHSLETKQTNQTLSSSPLATEGSFMEEANFKVGRYSPEERKEKILRYKAKRTQRNFNKTIKYACRKTLADNRPRIRGRFARNDEPGETPKTFTFRRYENEDELWMDGLQEEFLQGGRFSNTYMPTTQLNQFSYFRQ